MNRSALALVLVLLPACPSSPEEPGESSSSGSTGAGTDESVTGSDGSDGSSSDSSSGDPCLVGSLECPCTAGGSCDPGLACELGTCVEGCAVGSLGCTCTAGGTCDGGLACETGACIEGVSETCGDGAVDEFEECDDGADNGDAKACTSDCRLAVCGDGKVGPGEACDGGEGCTEGCSLTSCGDGKPDPGEDCEPSGPDDLECTANCTDARKVIFVTSEHYKGGEIGGVDGGDAKCQALADAAGLPGVFLAFLAATEDDVPLKRFTWHEGVPFVDVEGEVLAESWLNYKDAPWGLLPLLTETGEAAAPSELIFPNIGFVPEGWAFNVWSSYMTSPGFVADETGPRCCAGWLDTSASGTAQPLGAPAKSGWGGAACDQSAPILCMEQ